MALSNCGVWLEKRAFLVAVLTTVQIQCAFCQMIATVLNIFCMFFYFCPISSSTFIRAGIAVQGPPVASSNFVLLSFLRNTI